MVFIAKLKFMYAKVLFWELFGVNLCSLFGVTAKKVAPSERELPRLPRRSMLLKVWFNQPEA